MNELPIDPLVRPPDADVSIPGSKSITNRALVVAALAEGTSVLSGVLFADDTVAMMDCLEALGATLGRDRAAATVTVTGVAGRPSVPAGPLWADQSGTTARFILPVAALAGGPITVDAHEQMRRRPQHDLFDALATLGVRVEAVGEPGHLPVRLAGGGAGSDRIVVPGGTSSQYVSALLLAAPAMARELTIELVDPIVSMPYIDMTVAVMRQFGADVARAATAGGFRFRVTPASYRATDYAIEPDASSASYFFAAAAVAGGRVAVDGLGSASLQGDTAFVHVLAEMGAAVEQTEHRTEVRGVGALKGVQASMADISDTAPTLGAIAALAETPTEVRGIGFIRHKESDRIGAVVTELRRLGVAAFEQPDGFRVEPATPVPATVQTYDDHRIAMSFTVLGLVVEGISIADPGCVAKTFPEYFDAVDQLRAAGDADLRVLAIDGPAGSGKSTVAELVADRLGLEYLDTGAMYRSVTWAALRAGIDVEDASAVSALARVLDIDVGVDRVMVGDVDATAEIRSAEVNASVSIVATHPGVRAAMRRQQRAWARRRDGGVMEGRDIGSVVFPRAPLKVYVTATPAERARRRAEQSGRPYEEILAEIEGRDEIDSSRADSPLVEAHDAVVVDTTGMEIDEVVAHIAQLFEERVA